MGLASSGTPALSRNGPPKAQPVKGKDVLSPITGPVRYDLIVIGSGPAGRRAAVQAAKLGKSVLVVEKGRRVGGVSVHTGTIPSKTLRETVLNLSGWRERGFYGLAHRVKQNIQAEDLRKRLYMTLDHEVEILEHQFARNKVDTIRGAARFVDLHQIEIVGEDGETIRRAAQRFVLAVGTYPHRPANIAFDGETILDSDDILDLARIPRHLAVVGATVIGIEYATIFSAPGCAGDGARARAEPAQFHRSRTGRRVCARSARPAASPCVFGAKVKTVHCDGPQRCVIALEDGRHVRADMVLFAAGRQGATDRI